MTLKRFLPAVLCAVAVTAAACGGDDDNQTLSYEDTGDEISAICESVDTDGLTGDPQNDAPILERVVPDFESAVEQLRDLEVDEELVDERDEFADNADQQVTIIREAQEAAERGDARAYRDAIEQTQPLDRESEEIAAELGATGCIED